MLKAKIEMLLVVASLFCFVPQTGQAQIIDLCVDPGHGGTDPGNLTHYDEENWHEDDINLMVANALLDTLTYYGYILDVKYTRTTDTFIFLADRPDLASSRASFWQKTSLHSCKR